MSIDWSSSRVVNALHDCISVMERELNGLAVIQPELANAKEALAMMAKEESASDQEWSGEGLPPVGLPVEWLECNQTGWQQVVVLGYAKGDAWIKPQGKPSIIVGNPAGFRLIRTPDQIAADARIAAAQEWLKGIEREYGTEAADQCENILMAAEENRPGKQVTP